MGLEGGFEKGFEEIERWWDKEGIRGLEREGWGGCECSLEGLLWKMDCFSEVFLMGKINFNFVRIIRILNGYVKIRYSIIINDNTGD